MTNSGSATLLDDRGPDAARPPALPPHDLRRDAAQPVEEQVVSHRDGHRGAFPAPHGCPGHTVSHQERLPATPLAVASEVLLDVALLDSSDRRAEAHVVVRQHPDE